MLWYKGWLETKFKFLLMLGFMVFYLIVFYLMRNHCRRRPVARQAIPGLRFRPDCDCFRGNALHLAGGRWNQHPTHFSGDERPPRLHPVHAFPAGQPAPFADG